MNYNVTDIVFDFNDDQGNNLLILHLMKIVKNKRLEAWCMGGR